MSDNMNVTDALADFWVNQDIENKTDAEIYFASKALEFGYAAAQSQSGWVRVQDIDCIYLVPVLGYREGYSPTFVFQNPKNDKVFGDISEDGEFTEAPIQPTHVFNVRPFPPSPKEQE